LESGAALGADVAVDNLVAAVVLEAVSADAATGFRPLRPSDVGFAAQGADLSVKLVPAHGAAVGVLVFARGEALKIFQTVIMNVHIFVMNLIAVWDGADFGQPNVPVQQEAVPLFGAAEVALAGIPCVGVGVIGPSPVHRNKSSPA
jgi:hypothetical protein